MTPWTTACLASLSITISRSPMMPSSHLIFCLPLLLLPSIFPIIRVFSDELALCIRWLKYWSFSISPYSEYSGLISFRIDWFDLLAVQGTLKSLLQHLLKLIVCFTLFQLSVKTQCKNGLCNALLSMRSVQIRPWMSLICLPPIESYCLPLW